MEIKKISISEVKPNPNNPRVIKDNKFKSLVKSIKEFPQMLDIRPIVVDELNYILGGNMRFKACKEAGLTEIPIIIASNLTEQQKMEFIIKDNANFGDWDWEFLNENWDMDLISEWGVDIFELPNEVDYSLLDDEDDDDTDNKVKDKADGNSKSVLLPFKKPEDMAAFTKLMKQWHNDGLCPGHTALEAVKKSNLI